MAPAASPGSPLPLPARPTGLTVGPADDPLERDADRRADGALARLAAESDDPHRHGPGCDHLRRSAASSDQAAVGYAGGPLPDAVGNRIDRLRGSGSALPDALRGRMEQGFGTSLSGVRVHVGDEPAQLNRLVSADAFTVGRDIFFGAGQYAPESPAGERVLAHELAHTLQPDAGPARRSIVRRKLATGQSGKQVKDQDGRRYLVHETKLGTYSLRPLDGRPTVEVDVDSPDAEHYDVVGEADPTGDEVATAIRPDEQPDVAYDVLEWSGRMRSLISADDPRSALLHLERMKAIAGGLPTLEAPALSDAELAAETKKRGLKHGNALDPLLRLGLVRGPAWFEERATTVPLAAFGKAANADTRTNAIASWVEALKDLRRTPKMLPTIIRLIDRDVGEAERSIADDEQRVLDEKQKLEDRQAADAEHVPLLLFEQQPGLRTAYLQMTAKKFAKGDSPNKFDDAIRLSGLDPKEAGTRAVLLDHLEGPLLGERADEEQLAKLVGRLKNESVDDILAGHVHQKAARLAALFDAHAGLAQQVAGLVTNQQIHLALTAIAEGKQKHSIKDINDYVGDKLNDPLMDWVISRGIKVEVHATSALASFGKMRSEGFTEVLEVPSSHAGTKKFIVGNPETKEARVVFQTLPGASYAIQTTGAFLFYELYRDLDSAVAEKFAIGAHPWRYEGHTARNLISAEGGRARFLLVGDNESTMCAEVPFKDRPPAILEDGSIDVPVAEWAITVKPISVDRLSLQNLSVHTENVDYKAMYLDIMRKNGIENIEIASIGQKRELKKVLVAEGLKTPTLNLELPNFNTSVYRLKKTGGEDVNLALFQISPHFFGDRSGFLAAALKALGVKHVTFVGTAGGLGEGITKGQTVVPEEVAQVADETTFSGGIGAEKRITNAAFTDLASLRASAGMSEEEAQGRGLHVGVHSPITESEAMIAWMKAQRVDSVDCEAGFIADVLKNSAISLYAIYYISDVPGTHESIGQGGIAGGGHGEPGDREQPEANPSERLVKEIIKKAVGGTIMAADKKVAPIVPITNKGRIQMALQHKGTYLTRDLDVSVIQPNLVAGADTVELVRTFATAAWARLKDLEKEKGRVKVTLDTINELNTLAREFSELHRVKLVLKVVTP